VDSHHFSRIGFCVLKRLAGSWKTQGNLPKSIPVRTEIIFCATCLEQSVQRKDHENMFISQGSLFSIDEC